MSKFKLVIQLHCALLIVAALSTCSKDSYSLDDIRVFEEYDRFECGNYFFYLDGKYSERLGDISTVDGLDGNFIDFEELDENQLNFIKRFNIVTEIWHYHHAFQNLHGASSTITMDEWLYHLEYPDDERGTYIFEPSEKEMRILHLLVQQIIRNYPESIHHFNTQLDLSDFYPTVIYLEINEDKRIRKYFASVSTVPCEFSILFDFVVTVLRLSRENSVPTQDIEILQDIRNTVINIMKEYELGTK